MYPAQQQHLSRIEVAQARTNPIVKRESGSHRPFSHHLDQQHHPQHQQHQQSAKDVVVHEDGMPSTSDFVKKLYKYACRFLFHRGLITLSSAHLQDARRPIVSARRIVGSTGRLFCGQGAFDKFLQL
jgi:hypothetical protein